MSDTVNHHDKREPIYIGPPTEPFNEKIVQESIILTLGSPLHTATAFREAELAIQAWAQIGVGAKRQYATHTLFDHLDIGTITLNKKTQNSKDTDKEDTTYPYPCCVRRRAEYSCGHQVNQSTHRNDCERGKKCPQAFQARVPQKLAKPCRQCATAVSEAWEEVQEPIYEVDEDYLKQSLHKNFIKKLDRKTAEKKGENLFVKGSTALLERVASRLAMQRIEKRIAARGLTRRLEETPVIVDRNDIAEYYVGGEAWEQVGSEEGDWVEIDSKECDPLEP